MKISKEAKETLTPLVRDVHGHKMRDIGKEGQMRSGAAFLDLSEAAGWIWERLTDECADLRGYEAVLRVLHMETDFMEVVGLLEEPAPHQWQRGYVYRVSCWVLAPDAETEAHPDTEQYEEEV